LTRLQHVRVDLAQLKARLFLAAACRDLSARSTWLRSTAGCVRALRRERMPYASALANYIEANLTWITRIPVAGRGADADAATSLEAAADELARMDLVLLSNAARWQSGRLRNGPSGSGLIDNAWEWMTAQRVVNPERLLRSASLALLGVEPH
jgi:hypothetical protein